MPEEKYKVELSGDENKYLSEITHTETAIVQK